MLLFGPDLVQYQQSTLPTLRTEEYQDPHILNPPIIENEPEQAQVEEEMDVPLQLA